MEQKDSKQKRQELWNQLARLTCQEREQRIQDKVKRAEFYGRRRSENAKVFGEDRV